MDPRTGLMVLACMAWMGGWAFGQADPAAGDEESEARKPREAEEVLITASPVKGVDLFEAPHSAAVVGEGEIGERMPRTAGKTLLEVPGVHVQQTGPGQGAPFLRGLDPYRSLVLIDGIRLNHSAMRSGPNQYFGTIDPYLIGREEVMFGPASVQWGSDALGGTIYIQTREPFTFEEGLHTGARSRYRYASAENAHVGRQEVFGNLDNVGWSVGVTGVDAGDIVGGKHVGRMEGTGYEEYAGDVKVAWKADEATKVVFAAQRHKINNRPRWHSTLYNDDAWQGLATGSDLRRDQDQARDLYYVQVHWTPEDAFVDSLKASLSWQHHGEVKKRYRRAADGRRNTERFDLETPGIWLQAGKETEAGYFTAGVDLYQDRVSSDSHETDPTPTLPKTAYETYDRGIVAGDATYRQLGLFLQDEVAIGRLDVTAGVRFTHVDLDADDVDPAVVDENAATPDDPSIPNSVEETYSAATGSLRGLYHVTEHWNVMGGWGMGFRAPTLHDVTAIDFVLSGGALQLPATDLDPEFVHTFDLGAKAKYDDFSFSGTVFYSLLQDFLAKVDTGDGSGNVHLQNFGDGWIWGYELQASFRVHEEITLFGNAGFAFGRVDYPGATGGTSPLPKAGPRRGLVGVRYEPKASDVWVEGLVLFADNQHHLDQGTDEGDDPQRQPTPNGTPGYGVVTLRGGVKVCENATVTLSVENVTNRDYRIHGSGQNEPGTNVIVGLDMVF
jgi:hemoglobin/transferrin/lactoferrin receptor protein